MNAFKTLNLLLAVMLIAGSARAQFTRQDTLRGSITPERAWWDVTFYALDVEVDEENRFIQGSNTVRYRVLNTHDTMQLELQEPLEITKITQNGTELEFRKDGYSHFVGLKEKQVPGREMEVVAHYSGHPRESENPPWSGGFTWTENSEGEPWVVTTCQGVGASLWWPNKDHPYDEPDSMHISVTPRFDGIAVSNGRLAGTETNPDGTTTYVWAVVNPINNYGVNANIGDYAHFSDVYEGVEGKLDLDYYVMPYNLEKARKHFDEVPRVLEAFEYWFGPYPFREDGFKLVEVPYAGMEHQSSVTYGNGYENGYLGRDVSGSGWGMKFDFIIVHETAHEWFGNSITHRDVADMWIHESFASYAENLFVDYHFGTQAANEYVQGVRKNIVNNRPIIGTYGVHKEGSPDMYYKGANVLHTLRQLVENDSLWREVLRGLNREFYHSVVEGEDVENYISRMTGKDLSAFFNQYLRTAKVPVWEYRIEGDSLKFRYADVVENFDMPLRLKGEKETWIFPSAEWTAMPWNSREGKPTVDPNFYVLTRELTRKRR